MKFCLQKIKDSQRCSCAEVVRLLESYNVKVGLTEMSVDFFILLTYITKCIALQTVKMPDFSWIVDNRGKGWTVLRTSQKLCMTIELKQLMLLSVPF